MYKVELTCQHNVYVENPPRIGRPAGCPKCGCTRKIVSVEGEWHLRCTQCPYSRHFGRAKLTADVKATRHALKLHHKVTIWCSGREDLTHYAQDDTLELIGRDDRPPF